MQKAGVLVVWCFVSGRLMQDVVTYVALADANGRQLLQGRIESRLGMKEKVDDGRRRRYTHTKLIPSCLALLG
jgi:hypothetical protein